MEVEIVNVRACCTVALTETVSSVMIFVVIIPVSPKVPPILIIELVAEDGLVMVVLPVPWKVAFEPIRICIQRLAGTTAVFEVNVITDVVVETPQVVPTAVLASGASATEAQEADVLVAKSKLVVARLPKFHPLGKVIVIVCPAATPVGVTKLIV